MAPSFPRFFFCQFCPNHKNPQINKTLIYYQVTVPTAGDAQHSTKYLQTFHVNACSGEKYRRKKNEIALKALEKRNAAEKFHTRNQSSYPRKELGNQKEKEKSKIPEFFSTPFKQQVPTSSTNPVSATPQDEQETGMAYSLLSHPVHENLLTSDDQSNCLRSSTVSKTLHEIFLHGDSALKYMQGASSTKMNDYLPLHLSVWYRNKFKDYNIRALKAFSKRSKEHMSRKQQKKCGSFNLPQELHKFNVFKPMHEMWECYMKQVLKNTKGNPLSVAQSLLNADLHGAIILVAECKVKSFTGVRGIMIRETAETFGIITEDDKLRVVPKKFSVFVLQVYKWKITLHGDKLTSRNMGLYDPCLHRFISEVSIIDNRSCFVDIPMSGSLEI